MDERLLSLTALLARHATVDSYYSLGPTEQAILGETFPPEQRGLSTGLYGLVIVLGPTIGPLIGGFITDNYSWRWIFFINLPVGIIGSLMVAAFVPEPGSWIMFLLGVGPVGVAWFDRRRGRAGRAGAAQPTGPSPAPPR